MQRLSNIPEAKAKSILLALCSDNSQLERRALQFLDHIDARQHHVAAGDHQRGTKRKAGPPIKICVQCQDAFYEEENGDKACRYHDGELDVDYDSDVWADHDERCHGTIDTDENRAAYPEGFVWNCCGKSGYRGGCTRGRHDALGGQRGKYADKPGSCLVAVEESSSEDEQSSQESDSESNDDESEDSQ
ncbi:hypothetical protein F4801DRAFT_533397 [Xylaria longipes]|nr:hypothetical protein F4801DRAFT_533397 [Xylaria longipes]RYC57924.1 hypothetical protein CHU98_g8282 [Xylaria longipes]